VNYSLSPELRDPIPLFPLETVLYPGGLLPLRIFEPRYIDMVSESLRDETPFGIVPIKYGREVGSTPHFFRVGTIASIASWDQGDDGLLHIEVLGSKLFRVTNHNIRVNRLLIGDVDYLDEQSDAAIPQQFEYLRGLLNDVFDNNLGQTPRDARQMDSALWVAHRLAEVLPLDISHKVDILNSTDGAHKLSLIDTYLREIEKEVRNTPDDG
jgi:uncharacterized protein